MSTKIAWIGAVIVLTVIAGVGRITGAEGWGWWLAGAVLLGSQIE